MLTVSTSMEHLTAAATVALSGTELWEPVKVHMEVLGSISAIFRILQLSMLSLGQHGSLNALTQ